MKLLTIFAVAICLGIASAVSTIERRPSIMPVEKAPIIEAPIEKVPIEKTPIVKRPLPVILPIQVTPVDPIIIPVSPECDFMCTQEYRPVCCLLISQCGDCRTFGNDCALELYNCQNPGNQYYTYAQNACDEIGKDDRVPVIISA